VVRPDGAWNDERVIVFTEYRDTQRWLVEHLAAAGRPDPLQPLDGQGVDPTRGEHVAEPVEVVGGHRDRQGDAQGEEGAAV
jgi:ERCC4-related helicase